MNRKLIPLLWFGIAVAAYADTQLPLTKLQGISGSHGNTTKSASTGTIVSGNCVKLDANGNTIGAGSACSVGSGDTGSSGASGATGTSGVDSSLPGPSRATGTESSTGLTSDAYINSATHAVANTIQVKLDQTLSAKDEGAVGDGVTSDQTAIAYLISDATKEAFLDGGSI